MVINSYVVNSSLTIWSVDEETPEWTFIQIPLENIANEFQVGTNLTRSYFNTVVPPVTSGRLIR